MVIRDEGGLTPEEHKQRHVELHRALDELFADFILHHKHESRFVDRPIEELLHWSYIQTLNPTSPDQ